MVSAAGGGSSSKRSSTPPPGANPFASKDLLALRSTLPSKPELAAKVADGGGASAEVIATVGTKGGSRKQTKGTRGATPRAPGAIGSGTGASRGVEPHLQQVRVGVTRAGKRGKTVTVVDGLDPGGGAEGAKTLLTKFKKVLGTGGSLAENGAMSFQGDNAALLVEMLTAMGYKSVKQTGGLGMKN